MNNQRSSKGFYNFIKNADLFGEQVIFTFGKQSSFRSYTGFCFSLLLALIGLVMFIFMGQSFFFKRDPQTTASITKNLNTPNYNTTENEKMFVAIRYRDQSNLDYPGDNTLFYLNIVKYSPGRTPTQESRPATICKNSQGLDKNYLKENNLIFDNIYCIPLTIEDFGGSFGYENYNYFGISLSFCQSNYANCDRIKVTQTDSPNSVSFVDFWFPEVFFNPNDKDIPFQVKHSRISDSYFGKSYIYREVYFKKSILFDDLGWIFEEKKEMSEVTVGEQFSRTIYKDTPNDLIAKYNFYVGPVEETFTRKYQKIQDVVAIVGGFIKICQFLLSFTLSNFIKYLKNVELMNGIINFKNDENDEFTLPKNMNDKAALDSKVKHALRIVSNQIKNIGSQNNFYMKKENENSGTNSNNNNTIINNNKDNISNFTAATANNLTGINLDNNRGGNHHHTIFNNINTVNFTSSPISNNFKKLHESVISDSADHSILKFIGKDNLNTINNNSGINNVFTNPNHNYFTKRNKSKQVSLVHDDKSSEIKIHVDKSGKIDKINLNNHSNNNNLYNINLSNKISPNPTLKECSQNIYKIKSEIFSKGAKKKKKFNFSLTFSEIVKRMLCRKCLNRDQLIKVKIYDLAEEYLNERLDVFGYLDFINEFNKVKSILFNSHQNSSFDLMENPTINIHNKKTNLENVDNLKFLLPFKQEIKKETDIKDLTEYFAKKVFEQNLTYADKVLLMSLREDTLKEIIVRLMEVSEKIRMNRNITFKETTLEKMEEVLNF